MPLLRLDVGRIFGSVVGASEANLRQAIATAEAVSPCVLLFDEVEKGFSGTRSESGGGVAARVFGSFLSWLQDKRSPVFVVATANDIAGLPPEFLRQGRFDDTFFVGLPDADERRQILEIHLQRRSRDPEDFEIPRLVEATEGFSGAELEEAVIAGLYPAFEESLTDPGRDLTTADILAAVAETQPLSRARAQELEALVRWAQVNARPASRQAAA